MVWQLLAKPLLGVVADGVKGFVETKKAKQELKLTTIKATQKLKEDQIAGKVAWEQSAVDQMKGSWKDEVALIVLLLPAVLVFTPLQDHVHKGFLALQDLPSYYHNLLYIAISASFGIKAGSSAIGLFKKKQENIMKKNLKPIPKTNKGLPKLPKAVRNKMGFMKKGGLVQ